MSGRIAARLAELGITLPVLSPPVANYLPYVRTGNLLFVSGQIPTMAGELRFVGKLGREFEVQDGQKAARICAMNILAHVQAAIGDLDAVTRVVKLTGFVNAMPEFGQEPAVINGASDLMVEIFGDIGRHARAAVGVNTLPFRVAVEVEAIFELAP